MAECALSLASELFDADELVSESLRAPLLCALDGGEGGRVVRDHGRGAFGGQLSQSGLFAGDLVGSIVSLALQQSLTDFRVSGVGLEKLQQPFFHSVGGDELHSFTKAC